MNHCHEETDKENDATLALPYDTLCIIRLIASANGITPAQLVNSWALDYLDARKD